MELLDGQDIFFLVALLVMMSLGCLGGYEIVKDLVAHGSSHIGSSVI